VLGRGLQALPREQYVLSTKVGRYGQETFDFSAERVTASVRESLERLQVGVGGWVGGALRGSSNTGVVRGLQLIVCAPVGCVRACN
jgi:hypothetical protein